MTEDPRDQRRPEDADADSAFDEDEISLDELDEDSLSLLDSSESAEEPPRPETPRVYDDLRSEAHEDDEIVLTELDDETAGYFEVAAVEGGDTGQQGGEPVYEVEAAPPPRQEDEPPSEPTSCPRTEEPFTPPPRAEQPRPSHPAGGSSGGEPPSDSDGIRRLHSVEVEVVATLGTTRMHIKDILGLHVGSVVELHRLVGEPVDVTLNGRLIARGEVVVVDEKFAVRVSEIVSPDD